MVGECLSGELAETEMQSQNKGDSVQRYLYAGSERMWQGARLYRHSQSRAVCLIAGQVVPLVMITRYQSFVEAVARNPRSTSDAQVVFVVEWCW